MASEMSKNVQVPDEQEVTSHQRDQGVRAGISGGAAAGDQEADPLARQASIMSLTLEELQSSLCEPGRNFGSMNMDEFMANIWNAEEFQAATGGCKEGAEREAAAAAAAMAVPTGAGENGGGTGGLVRQGSYTLPPPLSRKTVEEVWAEINQDPGDSRAHAHPAPQAVVQPQMGSGGLAAGDRQATLGEMTLEDFLVKAGVVRGAFAGGHGQAVGMVPAGPMGHMQHQGQLAAAPMMYQVAPANAAAVYPVMGDGMGYHNGYAGGMAVVPPPPPSQCVAAAVSPGSSDGVSAMTQAEMMSCIGNGGMVRNGGGNARKRDSPEDGCTEKTVERRQRRMIKNRESAARSRARKQVCIPSSSISWHLGKLADLLCSQEMLLVQAYTVELEAELNHLKEENARLKADEVLRQSRNMIRFTKIFRLFLLAICACIDLTLSL
jgi:ABA responsive element binding factor